MTHPEVQPSATIPTPKPGFTRVSKYVARQLSRTGGNSDKCGKCEVCGLYADMVYHCTTITLCLDPDEGLFWSYCEGMTAFGHKKCVLKRAEDHHKMC